MAEFDDFDLKSSFDLDNGDSDGFEDISGSNSDDLGDWASSAQAQTAGRSADNKKSIIKQAAIIASVGIFVVALAFSVVNWLTGDKDDTKKDIPKTSQSQEVQNQTSVTTQTSDWKSFNEANIYFEEDYITDTFTITDIQHLVKVEQASGNVIVKTRLTGKMKQFNGLYTIDIPYSKGIKVNINDRFNVEVQVGEYNGKIVVGEIRY